MEQCCVNTQCLLYDYGCQELLFKYPHGSTRIHEDPHFGHPTRNNPRLQVAAPLSATLKSTKACMDYHKQAYWPTSCLQSASHTMGMILVLNMWDVNTLSTSKHHLNSNIWSLPIGPDPLLWNHIEMGLSKEDGRPQHA